MGHGAQLLLMDARLMKLIFSVILSRLTVQKPFVDDRCHQTTLVPSSCSFFPLVAMLQLCERGLRVHATRALLCR